MKEIVPNSKRSKDQPKQNLVKKEDKTSVNVAYAFSAEVSKLKSISFKVHLKCTDEYFNVKKFPTSMKIRDLKALLEFVCGIPFNLQRLSYLDDGELIDPKELTYYDVIEGAVVVMDVWTVYLDLVKTVIAGDLDLVLKQGVCTSIEWHSPASDYMFVKDKQNYIKERSGIAIFIASHRGNLSMVKGLFAHGADINYTSSYGRTPIIISIVADQMKIMDFLLDNHADCELCDESGGNAMIIAKRFNNKLAQHRLAQFKWKKRLEDEAKLKKETKVSKNVIPPQFSDDRLPHQVFDSSKKTWMKGQFMQMYMAQLVPLGEYSGGRFSAPKSIGLEVLMQRLNKSTEQLNKSVSNNEDTNEDGESTGRPPIEKSLTFDKWLEVKLKKEKELKELKRSAEAHRLLQLENATDNISRDVTSVVEIDQKHHNNTTNSKFTFSDQSSNKRLQNSAVFRADGLMSNPGSARMKKKHIEHNVVYKGMPYEEWTKVRDQFLKTHNML